jgi:hypothetical protein
MLKLIFMSRSTAMTIAAATETPISQKTRIRVNTPVPRTENFLAISTPW